MNPAHPEALEGLDQNEAPSALRLVVITGPIASGKTSVGQRVAANARERGLKAASIDLDVIVEMIAGSDWSVVTKEQRLLAPQLAAVIVQRLYATGISLIAVAGSTLSPYETELLVSNLDCSVQTLQVRLHVSLEESIRRAAADPTRIATRRPDVVTRHYARIDWDGLSSVDFDITTDGLALDEVVAIVAAKVLP